MRHKTHGAKKGLCLAGGGITGAMYEVGVLAAIEEACEDFRASDFDVIVGASAGAVVATGFAGGISAQRMYRALLDPADDFFPLQRQHLMRFDRREMKRVWGSALGSLRRILGAVTINPLGFDVWTEIDRFYDSLPAGVFTMDAFESFFIDFMTRRGLPHSFTEMPADLVLVANDLDGGERALFGRGAIDEVPVAKAVAASMAAPLLFAPVRIGHRDYIAGGVGEVSHIDVAIARGCELVIAVNAMIPVRAGKGAVPTGHGAQNRVRDKGMLWVYNQSWRLVAEARLAAGLEKLRHEHEDVTIELIEPARDDATMFMHSPMNFAARRELLEDGYTRTLTALREEGAPLRKALTSFGITLK